MKFTRSLKRHARGAKHVLALVLLTAAAGSALGQTSTTIAPADTAKITTFVQDAMAELGLVPGVALAVVQGDRIVYERGFGYRDVERHLPATPQTVFYTASLAKAFTGMTASVLAADGKLDLDAPLSRFFPALHLQPPLSADSVTVRQLLCHAKGFSNSSINFVTSFVGSLSDADLLRVLANYSTPTEGQFIYSNTNFALAGYVIARATRRPWQDVMADLVFRPVGMTRSTAYPGRAAAEGQALPYVARRDGFHRIPILKTEDTITGAGGIFSTAHDLARYVIANLNDGRVDGVQALPPRAVKAAQTPQVTLDARFFEFDRYAYGLGLYLARYDGDLLIHHFGGFPGYRSHLSFMPAHDLGVVVLQNEGIDGSRFADVVATYVYDLLLRKDSVEVRGKRRIAALRERVAAARQARAAGWQGRLDSLRSSPAKPTHPLAAYAGTYESGRLGRMHIVRTGDTLKVVYGALHARALPAGGDDFVVDWTPGAQPATLSFVVDEGKATELRWGSRPYLRVER